jgi:hypothetical protein
MFPAVRRRRKHRAEVWVSYVARSATSSDVSKQAIRQASVIYLKTSLRSTF